MKTTRAAILLLAVAAILVHWVLKLLAEHVRGTGRVILVAGAVATATAAGFVTANSPAATQACRLASVGKLHGHVSLTFNESATGVIPGTLHSITVSLSREATNVGVHLTKLRTKVPGYYVFVGRSSGGSFAVDDTYASGDDTGTLTAKGAVRSFTAGLGSHSGPCGYQLAVSFWTRASFSGTIDGSRYSTAITDSLLTRSRKAPSSGKLVGSALVPVDADGCGIDYGTAGCVGYSGGWSNDFTMFKRCGTTSAGTCPSNEDTDFGDATISWSLAPG